MTILEKNYLEDAIQEAHNLLLKSDAGEPKRGCETAVYASWLAENAAINSMVLTLEKVLKDFTIMETGGGN